MHTNYIFQFLVTRDGKKVITAGKDKKIKIWDWIKQKLSNTLMFHDDTVETICMSTNEKLLFSGGLDKKIGVWSLQSETQICQLNSDFPLRTLTLTDDNDYLIAEKKAANRRENEFCFWLLEKNNDAFRLNVTLKGVNCCYVTPNNMYMGLMDKKKLDIWNI